jgi:Cellulose biosynthesis protein BcsS
MTPLRSFLAAAVLLASVPAAAGERLVLTGGEVAEDAHYAYAGVILPLGRYVEQGWRQRWWIDHLGYEYDGGPGHVEARAIGVEAALAWSRPWSDGWFAASTGLRYGDTDLSPDDPGAEARGTQASLKLQVDAERGLPNGWRAGAIASWTGAQQSYWARLRVQQAPRTGLRGGVEAIAGGNDESRYAAAGLVWEWRPAAAGWTVGLRGGYRFQDEADGPYAGVEFGRSY